jgi:hypothetical protein
MQGVLGGLGRGGIFAGGDKRRLDEHLAQQDRAEAEAQARQNTAKENVATNEPTNANTNQSDLLLNDPQLSSEDKLVEEQILAKKESQNTFTLSEGGEEMVLPNELPRTGQGNQPFKLSPDGEEMTLPNALLGEQSQSEYSKLDKDEEIVTIEDSIEGDISSDYLLGNEFILPKILPKTGSGEVMTEYRGPGREMTAGIFSNLSYENGADYKWNNIPKDWRDAGEYYKGSYYSKVFVNDDTKEIVIAHRGSDDIGDWLDIGGNAFSSLTGLPHYQVKYGLQVHDKIAQMTSGLGYEIIHSGHSLGGHIAEYVAMKKKVKAFSYDPLYGFKQDGYDNIWRYAPDDGVYAYSKLYVSGKGNASFGGMKDVLKTHNLGNILTNLNDELVFKVYDQINPMADGVYEKSINYNNLF